MLSGVWAGPLGPSEPIGRRSREDVVTPSWDHLYMAQQLVLLDEDKKMVRLDERTREIGRRGVAEARRVLMETRMAAFERAGGAAAA